jgi:hypothetical protein
MSYLIQRVSGFLALIVVSMTTIVPALVPAAVLDSGFVKQGSSHAAVHLLTSASGRCTAVAVSPKGLYLSARHCLQQCLIVSGVFKPMREQGVTYFRTDREMLGNATCAVQISGRREVITIEATSPGLVTAIDEPSLRILSPALYFELTDHGFMSRGDFVLFRIPQTSSLPAFFRLADRRVTDGEQVRSLGYPTRTSRPGTANSDGTSLYSSHGEVVPGIESNSCVQEAAPKEPDLKRLKERFDEPTAFLSTLDAIYGSSGSPVIDRRNRIVGILTNVYRHSHLTLKAEDEPEKRYCRGSAKALRSDQIFMLIEAVRPDLISELRN